MSLSSEIDSLYQILEHTTHSARLLLEDDGERLHHVIADCNCLLDEISAYLGKYSSLGDSSVKRRRPRQQLAWAIKNNVTAFRSRLISNITILTALNTNLMQ